jgi:hypothetical protein
LTQTQASAAPIFELLAKKGYKIRPELAYYTHPPDAASKSSFSKSSSDIILKMLRQAFRLRQRSILPQVTRSTQNISLLRISQTRTFQTTTRKIYYSVLIAKAVNRSTGSLYDDSDTTFSPRSSPSLNDKVDHFHSELAHLTKCETFGKRRIAGVNSCED